jgi:transposase
MGATRRRFTLEFKTEAAHRVIDSGRSVAEVARERSIGEDCPYRWVRDERRRLEAATMSGDEPLSPSERKELIRLRKELAELRKDNEFLGIPAA